MTWNMVWNIWDMWYEIIWCGIWDMRFLHTVQGGGGGGVETVVTFNLWAGPSIFSSATTEDVWIIPYLPIWGNMLNVEHVSCVITDCCQHQWVITPYLFMSCWSKTLSENHYLKNCFSKFGPSRLLSLYSFCYLFPYFLLVGLLL